jgi:hypothetical protein
MVGAHANTSKNPPDRASERATHMQRLDDARYDDGARVSFKAETR